MDKRFWSNFLRSLAAVVIGNLIYLFVLMKYLPTLARHRGGHLDFGLIIDFWLCVAIWGVLRLLIPRRG